jgi:hypothetical protein
MNSLAAAIAKLVELRGKSPGWGYRPNSEPYVEPTVLCNLGLLASADELDAPKMLRLAAGSAEWLATIQQKDGSVGPSKSLPEPSWPTPYALLLWTIVDELSSRPHFAPQRTAAALYLLRFRGKGIQKGNVISHDGMIPGWPWVAETHPWVEPTVTAILALTKAGHGDSQRIIDGRRLLRDRSLPHGGWNYGNTVVLDQELRPQPGPTGWALLGLVGDDPASRPVWLGIDYLKRTLPFRAALSLGLSILAMAAWKQRPSASAAWLAAAAPESFKRSDAAFQLAFLVLAAYADRTLELLGLRAKGERG